MADPAAQLERTALAWQRTALALAVNGALLAKATPALGPAAVAIGGAVLAVAAGVWFAAWWAYRRRRGTRIGALGHPRAIAAVTGCVVVGSAITCVVIFSYP